MIIHELEWRFTNLYVYFSNKGNSVKSFRGKLSGTRSKTDLRVHGFFDCSADNIFPTNGSQVIRGEDSYIMGLKLAWKPQVNIWIYAIQEKVKSQDFEGT